MNAIADGDKRQIEHRDWQVLVEWLNAIFAENKKEIVKQISASEHSTYEEIALIANDLPQVMPVEIRERPLSRSGRLKNLHLAQRRRSVTFRKISDKLIILLDEAQPFDKDERDRLLLHLVRLVLLGQGRYRALYLPAARTGLVLAFKVLVAGLFRKLEDDDDEAARLTLPPSVLDFLEDFNARRDGFHDEHSHFEIAQKIEKTILNGEIEQTENDEILFKPTGAEIALPLNEVSSLVTELTPLVVLLKSGLENHTLIFEEPEAHLHLEAQRLLARSLAQLMNSGVQLIITTHSDTFLQQLNILMEFHDHPKRDQLLGQMGYHKNEIIDPSSARGFLFEETEEGTVVRDMNKTRSGFVEPVMNRSIAELTKETFLLDAAYADTENA